MCNIFVLYLCLIYTTAKSVIPEERECDIANKNVGILIDMQIELHVIFLHFFLIFDSKDCFHVVFFCITAIFIFVSCVNRK